MFQKNDKAHLRASAIPIIFPGLYLRTPLKGKGRDLGGKEREDRWEGMDSRGGEGGRNKEGKVKEKESRGTGVWKGRRRRGGRWGTYGKFGRGNRRGMYGRDCKGAEGEGRKGLCKH
jgi:hypothetical protein